jgi:hypothetical protein
MTNYENNIDREVNRSHLQMTYFASNEKDGKRKRLS